MTQAKRGLLAIAVSLFAATAAPMAAQAQTPAYPANYAEDRAQIEDLMARYLYAMDWGDLDAYAALFTLDGEIEYSAGLIKGREAIKASVTAFKERIANYYRDPDGNPAKLRHVLLQTVIRVDGDRAWATAYWLEMANTGPKGEPLIGTYGTYEDELARVDGHWLFTRRRINNEFLKGRNSGDENPVRRLDAARP